MSARRTRFLITGPKGPGVLNVDRQGADECEQGDQSGTEGAVSGHLFQQVQPLTSKTAPNVVNAAEIKWPHSKVFS